MKGRSRSTHSLKHLFSAGSSGWVLISQLQVTLKHRKIYIQSHIFNHFEACLAEFYGALLGTRWWEKYERDEKNIFLKLWEIPALVM